VITFVYLDYSAVNIVAVFKRFFESEFPWTFLFILVMWESTITWYKWYDISNHHLNHKIHYCYLYRGHQFHVISRISAHYISRDLPVWLHLIMRFMQIIMVLSEDRLFYSNYTFISNKIGFFQSLLLSNLTSKISLYCHSQKLII